MSVEKILRKLFLGSFHYAKSSTLNYVVRRAHRVINLQLTIQMALASSMDLLPQHVRPQWVPGNWGYRAQ